MKRLLAMLVLTPPEQRLVIFVMLALVIGVSIKHNRDMKVYNGPSRGDLSPVPIVTATPNRQ
jgi:hypothetical protein